MLKIARKHERTVTFIECKTFQECCLHSQKRFSAELVYLNIFPHRSQWLLLALFALFPLFQLKYSQIGIFHFSKAKLISVCCSFEWFLCVCYRHIWYELCNSRMCTVYVLLIAISFWLRLMEYNPNHLHIIYHAQAPRRC